MDIAGTFLIFCLFTFSARGAGVNVNKRALNVNKRALNVNKRITGSPAGPRIPARCESRGAAVSKARGAALSVGPSTVYSLYDQMPDWVPLPAQMLGNGAQSG